MALGYEDIYEDKYDKYQQKYHDGEISQWEVMNKARASADRAHAAGDYVRNAPQQLLNPMPSQSAHDSVDSDSDAEHAPQQQASGAGQQSDDDYLNAMFAPAGGLGAGRRRDSGDIDDADDAESEVDVPKAAPSRKMGWGGRLWNGMKALGGILKNATGYNLIRHGIGGAFRKSKIAKNQRKLDAATEELDAMKLGGAPDPVRGGDLQRQFNEAEKKIHFNRMKLGENRKYRTGREWKNEWSRLFTGRDAKLSQARDRYQHGFAYAHPNDARSSGSSSSSSSASLSGQAPVDAPVNIPAAPVEQQVQQPAPQPIPQSDPQPSAQQQPAGHETMEAYADLLRQSVGDDDNDNEGYGQDQLNNFMHGNHSEIDDDD